MVTAMWARWVRLRDALKRELLRDPDVILFNRAGDEAVGTRDERIGAR